MRAGAAGRLAAVAALVAAAKPSCFAGSPLGACSGQCCKKVCNSEKNSLTFGGTTALRNSVLRGSTDNLPEKHDVNFWPMDGIVLPSPALLDAQGAPLCLHQVKQRIKRG